jgi:hypothetical protein
MVDTILPTILPLAWFGALSACCFLCSWRYAKRTRTQTEILNQRLLTLEQAPVKIIVQEPIPTYYPDPISYQTSTRVPIPAAPPQPIPSASQPIPSASQPKPSAPPSYPSYYPPYSSAYQGQQHPVVR